MVEFLTEPIGIDLKICTKVSLEWEFHQTYVHRFIQCVNSRWDWISFDWKLFQEHHEERFDMLDFRRNFRLQEAEVKFMVLKDFYCELSVEYCYEISGKRSIFEMFQHFERYIFIYLVYDVFYNICILCAWFTGIIPGGWPQALLKRKIQFIVFVKL